MILNRQRTVRVVRRPLELFEGRVREELGLGQAEVAICLVSDAEITRMNEVYRRRKGPTDVLSFPAVARRKPLRLLRGARVLPQAAVLGDIAISPATARRYAKRHGRNLREELQVLMLHGMLHLLGYDHETDRGEMNRMEQRLRRRLGLA